MKRIAILWLVALAACATPKSPSSPAKRSVELGIVVIPSSTVSARSASLQCNGTTVGTGYLSDQSKAKAACEAALANDDLLINGPPKDRVCTQQYGGPETARVSGRIRGKTVNATFNRADGCGISDWEKLKDLLGEPSGSGSATPA